jgi:thiamine pyrophosphate-dependent acetolactate synthase large subunit-like protein
VFFDGQVGLHRDPPHNRAMNDADPRLTYAGIFGAVFARLPDALLVPNLGTNTALAYRYRPSASTLFMWGGMGLTHSIGLGLALSRPDRPVAVFDGDGSLLMGLAGLATIGVCKPPNLLHVVLDNSAWGNTGGQPTHTANGVWLDEVAKGCGYPRTARVQGLGAFEAAVDEFVADPRCTMLVVPIGLLDVGRPDVRPEPVLIKHEFMRESTK